MALRPHLPALALALSLVATADATAEERSFATDRPTPPKVALIVSVSDYPDELHPTWTDLPGARNDVDLVRGLLVDSFGFDPEDVLVLRDAEATHRNIVRAFHEWLILRAGPETEAVFWFSGHGSRVPDRSEVKGAERDGSDSTLLAYDSRTGGREGEYDLSDDELASLLLALTRRTGRVTLVTDSCHSGGMARGAGPLRVRSGPAGRVEHDFSLVEPFWPSDVPFHDDGGPRADPGRYVHVSACGPHQTAAEWTLDDEEGTSYGALTLFLSWRLRQVERGETYRQIVDTVGRWISTRLDGQSVQREGSIDREFLGARFEARPRGFEATARGRELAVAAGRMHGLRRGSTLRVTDLRGEEVGRAEVTDLRDVSAVATWKGSVPAGTADLAMVAVEVERPAGREPLALRVAHPALAERISERNDVRLVASDRALVHRLEVEPPDARPGSPATVVFRDVDGVRIWPGPTESAPREDWLDHVVDALAEPLRKERRYLEVMALAGVAGPLALESRFVPLTAEDLEGMDVGEGRRAAWGARMSDAAVRAFGSGVRRGATSSDFVATLDPHVDGAPLARLDVSNPTDQPVHVTVLSATEAREITVIWPPEGIDFVVGPHETRPVYTILGVQEGLELARPMRDRFLVIATREPANFHPLAQATTLRSAPRDAPAGVPPLIENALTGRVTRGRRLRVEEPEESFGVAAVDVLVAPAPDGQ
ncbi:MAG: caspase domain-containing protein [Planctomycetota bacterium JB042]